MFAPSSNLEDPGFLRGNAGVGRGCLHRTSSHLVDSGPSPLISCGHPHPSPHTTKSGSCSTGSVFWLRFSVLPSFWVSGNFPHFLLKSVIACKRVFVTIYSALCRCFIWGGSSSNLTFHHTGNESSVRHFTWIVILINNSQNLIMYILLVQEIQA